MAQPIILIGPMCAGKSTISCLLAARLGRQHYELDDLRWDYYKEIGYDEERAGEIAKSAGTLALLAHWKPYEAYAVRRVVQEKRDGVIAFGAGHTVYDDKVLAARVERALAPIVNVILLLPSPNVDRSVQVLNARFAALLKREVGRADPELLDLNERFVRHPANPRLAKQMVYTEGQTPEETCDEVIRLIRPGI